VILAAGLTPAWQQILRFERLEPGEVNRAAESVWCASGKVLNVGIALAQLGAASKTISPLGGPAKAAIEQEFADLGVPRRWIESSSPTRVCTTLLDEATGTTTELVENAKPLPPAELDALRAAFSEEASQASVVVLTGSLPAGTPSTFYLDLLKTTRALAVVDARGPELLAALECEPLIVKPNREELSRTVGRSLDDDRALLDAMRELNQAGAEWVVVTQGKDAVWATSADEAYRLTPLPVDRVVNPIGCGDCLAAGIAWGLSLGKEPLESVSLGMAAAAQNLSQLLPSRIDPETVKAQSIEIAIERVQAG
jgi:1-phosphofructokinase family hexose kinase